MIVDAPADILSAPDSQSMLETFERTGDPRAFDAIVAAERERVLAICRRMLRNRHDAEDATQAVFLTLALQARGGNSIHAITPWLAKVARHVCLDAIKARKRRRRHEDSARAVRDERVDTGQSVDAQRAAQQSEIRRRLETELEALPPIYRAPMVLFYFGGLSLREISRQLGVSRKALSVRLLRARRMLAQQLASHRVPWFAVALVPTLLPEIVRSVGMPLTPSPRPSLLAAIGVSNVLTGRRAMLAALLVGCSTVSVGSASLVSLIPAAREWLPAVSEHIRSIKEAIRGLNAPIAIPTLRAEAPASVPVSRGPQDERFAVIRRAESVAPFASPIDLPPPSTFAAERHDHLAPRFETFDQRSAVAFGSARAPAQPLPPVLVRPGTIGGFGPVGASGASEDSYQDPVALAESSPGELEMDATLPTEAMAGSADAGAFEPSEYPHWPDPSATALPSQPALGETGAEGSIPEPVLALPWFVAALLSLRRRRTRTGRAE